MNIDNFEQCKKIMEFLDKDKFYHLQLLKRKKENPEVGQNARVIKTYYISSLEYFDSIENEVKAICRATNSRACLNLNRRSFEKMAFHLMQKTADIIMNKDYRSCRKAYESVCGKYVNEPNKKWIIDFDNDIEETTRFKAVDWVDQNKITCYASIPTLNGFHYIVAPFRLDSFKTFYPQIDVHKNNPTILYYSDEGI